MTVKELIEILEKMPQDYEVWIDYGEEDIVLDKDIHQDYNEKKVWFII